MGNSSACGRTCTAGQCSGTGIDCVSGDKTNCGATCLTNGTCKTDGAKCGTKCQTCDVGICEDISTSCVENEGQDTTPKKTWIPIVVILIIIAVVVAVVIVGFVFRDSILGVFSGSGGAAELESQSDTDDSGTPIGSETSESHNSDSSDNASSYSGKFSSGSV